MTKWLGRDTQGRIIDVNPGDSDDSDAFGILAGSDSPVGLSAQPGTLYRRSDGTLWIKTGAANADWAEVVTNG